MRRQLSCAIRDSARMSAIWLSYAPRVLLQHDFLTQKECAFLIKLAKEQGL